MVIGKVLTIDELMNDYGFEAVYVASGAGLPALWASRRGLNGVYSANEYLTRVNLMKAYKEDSRPAHHEEQGSVAVVGGGNVAMDAARCAKRLGAENVYIVYYRHGMAELPARKEEVEHAEGRGHRLLRR